MNKLDPLRAPGLAASRNEHPEEFWHLRGKGKQAEGSWASPSKEVAEGAVRRQLSMLNLPKAFTDQDIISFDISTKKLACNHGTPYTVEPKITGLAVGMIYEEGNLIRAFSCGAQPGYSVVTGHIRTILTVPLTLIQMEEHRPVPELLSVWGIVYLEKQAFAELNQQRAARGLPLFVHPDDAVEDSLQQANPRVTAKRHLNVFCHGADLSGYPEELSHYDLVLALQLWGFRVNRPHIRLCKGVKEVIHHCHNLKAHKADFPYELDGAIITLNTFFLPTKMGEEMGRGKIAMMYLFRAA
jgi:DNA ligase (NAD+)